VNKQVHLVINTPSARRDAIKDDASIRKAALKYKIPYMTTLAAAHASALGIAAARTDAGAVKSIQEYHAELK
jgi:carbamoyl-phosphate synthase large subunit